MQRVFVNVQGVPTNLLKLGNIGPSRLLTLIIPGNPGIPGYYEEFMQHYYEQSHCQLPIWCIAHAGHVTLPPDKKPLGRTEDVFGQIRHKLAFIQEHIAADVKLLLIGHSIGCYIILHLLKQLPGDQVIKCLMLFPTIERMARSPNGKIFTPTFRYFRWLAPILAAPVYYFVPRGVKLLLIKWWMKGRNVPQCAVDSTLNLANPSCVWAVLHMAYSELCNVNEADHDIIEAHLHKLLFYHGTTDGWCPVEYYHDMKSKCPTMDIYLCGQGMEHAFVLESSQEMADWLVDWLHKNVKEVKSLKSVILS